MPVKLKLDMGGIEDNFFTGTRLLGIMSQLKYYRFCWLVNSQMGFDFRLNADFEIQLKRKGRLYFFPVYQYCEAACELEHYIYYNQFEGEYLLPEFRHLDFLWLIKGEIIAEDIFNTIQQDLKKIQGVQLAAELTQDKIKNKSNLIF